jgi:hypothetical protein
MLERLGDRDPLPTPSNVSALMAPGFRKFDRLRPVKVAAPSPTSATPARVPAARPARRRDIPLVPLALLVFLALTTIAVLWVVATR